MLKKQSTLALFVILTCLISQVYAGHWAYYYNDPYRYPGAETPGRIFESKQEAVDYLDGWLGGCQNLAVCKRNMRMVTRVEWPQGNNYYKVFYRIGNTYDGSTWWFCCGPEYGSTLYWVDRGDDDDEPKEDQKDGEPDCSVGNPIDVATGSKFQKITLLDLGNGFNIDAYYQSLVRAGIGIGSTWSIGFQTSISDVDQIQVQVGTFIAGSKIVKTADNEKIYFSPASGGSYTALYGKKDVNLSAILVNGSISGFQFRNRSGVVYQYDASGKIEEIEDKNNFNVIQFSYSSGVLSSINDIYGKSIVFSYMNGKINKMEGSNGLDVVLTYNPRGFLKKIDTTDRVTASSYSQTFEYYFEKYNNQVLDIKDPDALVGIFDETGKRYATWDYDTNGRANYSAHGDVDSDGHRSEEQKLSFAEDGVTSSLNPFGKESKFHFDSINGVKKISKVEGLASSNCSASNSYYTYDANGFEDKITDWNGNVTDFDYSDLGLIDKITEGLKWTDDSQLATVPTNATRITEYDWDESSRKLLEIRTPGLTTRYDYWPNKRIKRITQIDTTNVSNSFGSSYGRTRTWDFTYSYRNGNGIPTDFLVDTIIMDGPAIGTNDKFTYRYDSKGNLVSFSDAFGHTVQYMDYNAHGDPQTIINENGVKTKMTYHPRGWLESVTVKSPTGDLAKDTISRLSWHPNGNLSRITHPNGSFLDFKYNDARHLIEIANNLGERIVFDPNEVGDWRTISIYDAGNNVVRQHMRTFDELGRIKALLNPDFSNNSEYEYDPKGNVVVKQENVGPSVSSPTQVITSFQYDALNRLIKIEDALHAITDIQPDQNGYELVITDARSNATNFIRDGFGQIIEQRSPDTGITQFWYDSAGKLTRRLDARGVTVSYTNDVLGRRETENYSNDSSLNTVYSYDQTTINGEESRGIGKLSSIKRLGANIYYVYDYLGNVIADIHDISQVSYATRYKYNSANLLESMAYPSGRTYSYAHDALGRIKTISVKDTATSTAVQLARSVIYEPFGQMKSFIHRNNIQHSRLRDIQGRLTDITEKDSTSTFQDLHFDYDWAGNIEKITDRVSAANNQTFGYSDIAQLQNAAGSYGFQAFTYDLVGNRITTNTNSGGVTVSEIFTIAGQSNRISNHLRKVGSASAVVKSFAYNAAGNATATSTNAMTYDGDNRIKTVSKGSVTLQFAYNALGERISKLNTAAPSNAVHFHYDLSGRMIAESSASGVSQRDYVWLGDQLVAIQAGAIATTARYSVHSNHLNTPVMITNSSRAVSWKAEYEPYGNAKLLVNSFTNNLRYPGQYFDSETGLHYNYFRDYDPALGRFLQSDPIGLAGGLNTYAYVGGNPINHADPDGLMRTTIDAAIQRAIQTGDIGELRTLSEVASGKQSQLINKAIEKFSSTAKDWIGKNCKGSINREFPEQLRDKTLEQIRKMSQQGDAGAKKAWKLLNDNRFQK